MSKSLIPATAGLLLMLVVAGCGSSAAGPSVAATVNGQDISMATYNKEFDYQRVAAENNYNFDVCSTKQTAPLCSQVKRTAMNTIIGNAIVAQYAAKHHIAVTDADFNRRWSAIYATSFHNQQRVLDAYAKRYGWTADDLKASIRRDILQEKVMLAVTRSMSSVTSAVKLSKIDVPTRQYVSLVKHDLKAGKPFAQVIAELRVGKKAPCSSTQNCGELGWLPTAFLPRGDKAALTAAPGTTVGPFTGQSVFEFLHVEGHNSQYRMTTAQQLQMRQRLFASWVADQERRASITQHVHV